MAETAPANASRQVLKSWDHLVSNNLNEYVAVDDDVLDALAQTNPDLQVPDWRIPGLNAANDWAYATQNVVSSVINYAYLDPEVPGGAWSMENPERPGQQIASSNALHTRTLQVFGEAEDITSDQIRKLIQLDKFDRYLPGIPLAASRRCLLGDFATGLQYNYGGSVRNLLESTIDSDGHMRAFNNGEGLVEKLLHDDMGNAFHDTGNIGSTYFPFNKRAQLAPLLIHGRAESDSVLPRFADIDKIGPVVDYQLPRALRHMGALTYSPELAQDVDNWQPIAPNSRKEIEIRAATAYSVDRLLRETNKIREGLGQSALNMAHVDFWLWKMGRELKKLDHPPHPHFTETTSY